MIFTILTSTPAAEALQGFARLYKIICAVGVAGAVVSLAMTGLMMIVGNEQGAAKAKHAAIYIIIAVAILYLIPVGVQVGINFGSNLAWNPPVASK